MTAHTHAQVHLLLTLTQADSRQELLDQLLIRVPGLTSVTLWWHEGAVQTPIAHAGIRPDPAAVADEREMQRLPSEPRYLLSLTPGVHLRPEVVAVLGLRLLYLDAQHLIASLNNQRITLETEARTDALTGLLNRRAFDTDLDAIDAAGGPFAVVYIDLDGFKALNDRFGHALGDSMLRGYAAWLSRVTGAWGQAYRMGGDEYLILVTSYPGTPESFAEWANERLQVPFVDGVSASIGIAWRHETWRVSDLVRLADQRMYQAKSELPIRELPAHKLPTRTSQAETPPETGTGR
jgi:diguanylate cyclase